MKKINFKILPFLILLGLGHIACAQKSSDESVNEDEVHLLINKMVDSLAYYYVDKDEGIDIGNHLKNELNKGSYSKNWLPEELAKKITQDLRHLNGDLHLFLKYHKNNHPKEKGSKSTNNRGLATNYGFQEI